MANCGILCRTFKPHRPLLMTEKNKVLSISSLGTKWEMEDLLGTQRKKGSPWGLGQGQRVRSIQNQTKKQSWYNREASTWARSVIHLSNKLFVPSILQCPQGFPVWWLRRSHAGIVRNAERVVERQPVLWSINLCSYSLWRKMICYRISAR